MKNNEGERKVLLNMNVFFMINHQYEKDKMRENCSNPINLDNLKHLHCYYNLSFVFFKTFLFLLFFSLGIPVGLKHAAQPRKDLDFFSSCLCLRVLIPGERQLGGTEDPGDRASRRHARLDSAHRATPQPPSFITHVILCACSPDTGQAAI